MSSFNLSIFLSVFVATLLHAKDVAYIPDASLSAVRILCTLLIIMIKKTNRVENVFFILNINVIGNTFLNNETLLF